MQSMQRESLVETLLNTLEAERYLRAPLLSTVVDELSAASGGLEVAAAAARTILAGLQLGRLAEDEFVRRVVALRHLVQALSSLHGSEVAHAQPARAGRSRETTVSSAA